MDANKECPHCERLKPHKCPDHDSPEAKLSSQPQSIDGWKGTPRMDAFDAKIRLAIRFLEGQGYVITKARG